MRFTPLCVLPLLLCHPVFAQHSPHRYATRGKVFLSPSQKKSDPIPFFVPPKSIPKGKTEWEVAGRWSEPTPIAQTQTSFTRSIQTKLGRLKSTGDMVIARYKQTQRVDFYRTIEHRPIYRFSSYRVRFGIQKSASPLWMKPNDDPAFHQIIWEKPKLVPK